MIAFLLGLFCGCINFLLLIKLVGYILQGKVTAAFLCMFCKLLVLAAALLPAILWMKNDVLWLALGLGLPLIVGAFLYGPVKSKLNKWGRRKGRKERND